MVRLRPTAHPSPPLTLRAILALSLALVACEASDSMDTIWERQAAGDYAATLEPLRERVGADPTDAEASFLYGRALVSTGQLSVATWPLRQAMQDPEWLVPAGMQLAQAGLTSRDFNEVIAVTTRILEAHPDDAVALLYRAQAQAYWRKDPAAALADADRALEIAPDLLEAYEPRILALLALDRHGEARESLAEAGRMLEESGGATATLAWHCSTTAVFAAEAGEVEEARAIWEDCLARYPANLDVVHSALQFFDTQGESERAIGILRRALEETPGQRALRVGLAERLRRAGSASEGEALLLEATQVEHPGAAAGAWTDVASYRHKKEDHAGAAEAFRQAIELLRPVEDPGPQLLFQYADALVVSGQLDRALEVAEELSVPALRRLILGRVAQERGNAARALEEFDVALRVWPNNPSARYYAALAAEQVGDFDRALEEYRYSIRISVGATDARTRAARLLIAQGRLQQAYQLLFLEAAKFPLEAKGELLSMYLMARVGNPAQLQASLTALAARHSERLPAALVRGAEGAADLAGPGAGLRLLISAPGVDYSDPRNAPALLAIVRFAHAVGEPQVARKMVDAALAAEPDAAVFQEANGLSLELAGAAPGDVRAAYQRAVELDPDRAVALAGLGRLAIDREPAQAVELFDRAAKADPSDRRPELEAARALIASGDIDQARQRLDGLLERHPLEADAALEIVSLDLAHDVVTEATLERALRAVRFGGGIPAYQQLARVYAALGRAEEAAETEERVRLLRDRLQLLQSTSGE